MILKQVDPAELSPGQFVAQVRHAVDTDEVRLVVIDSLNGFLHAMTGESDLPLQLHELLTFLGRSRSGDLPCHDSAWIRRRDDAFSGRH